MINNIVLKNFKIVKKQLKENVLDVMIFINYKIINVLEVLIAIACNITKINVFTVQMVIK